MSIPTVVVTGAFGQVGRQVTEILLQRGHRVVAMDLAHDKSLRLALRLAVDAPAGRLIPAFADLLDANTLDDIITEYEPSAIVHLAAMFAPSSYRNPSMARRVNVEGTTNLLTAAAHLDKPPVLIFASSAAVYGSRNPYRYPELITATTPVNPIDQYGQDKVLAEQAITTSDLPFCIMRLGGVISPDGAGSLDSDYLLLMRATPGDNRLHTVDSRDVGLAFANAVDRSDTITGTVLLIGGDESHLHTHRDVEDDMMAAVGLGRLGPQASLPGNPCDDLGWSFTGWLDTTQAQHLLQYQTHDWAATTAWVAASQPRLRPVLGTLGPLLRPLVRKVLQVQQRREHRGPFADPWTLIADHYGPGALAQ